jgi:outer membrane protein insertion porin family
VSGLFHQRQQDSTYVQRRVEGRADISVVESFTFGGFISHTVVIPSATLSHQPLHASRILSVGLTLNYDSRDDAISPSRGVAYSVTYGIGSKKFFSGTELLNGSTSVQSLSLDLAGYKEIVQHQVLAASIHARQVTGSGIQITDYFRFGGAATLRGYRENQILGSRVAWTNSEYRFLLERHSYFFLLFDAGFSYLPGDPIQKSAAANSFNYGYGIGLRVDSPLGNIGVSLAFGKGDSFSTGKLHFGLLNTF